MKDVFGTGEYINYNCKVVRGTAEINIPANPEWRIVAEGFGLSADIFKGIKLPIWLGDYGNAGNYIPSPPVSLEYKESHEWIQNLGFTIFPGYEGPAFILERNTPFEWVPFKGNGFMALEQPRRQFLNKKGYPPLSLNPSGTTVFSTNLEAGWGYPFRSTLVRSGNNYCSMGLTDEEYEPPSFGGIISDDNPDGDVIDEPKEDDPIYEMDFFILSSFTAKKTGNKLEYKKEKKYEDYRDFSNIHFSPNSHQSITLLPSEMPKSLTQRHGVSFLFSLIGIRLSSIVYDQLNFNTILKKSLKKNEVFQINEYIFFKSGNSEFKERKETIYPSDKSALYSTSKIWSFSHYDV